MRKSIWKVEMFRLHGPRIGKRVGTFYTRTPTNKVHKDLSLVMTKI